MDNEMIERVAKALCDFDLGKDAWDFIGQHDCRDDYKALAKIAIKAMREPTDKILSVNVGSIHWSSEEVWQMYIDAVIND